jgi:hypothetical protein
MIRLSPNAKLPVVISVALIAVCIACGRAAATASRHTLTVYARVTQAQFMDHSDDRIRGNYSNPFSTDTTIPPPKDGTGALPGDNALFTFKLYSDASLKNRVGTGTYSCTFNFAHRALCEANFELHSGLMIADGPVDFNSTRFTLAVTSGTGKYLGVRGQVASSPSSANVHRLSFLFS